MRRFRDESGALSPGFLAFTVSMIAGVLFFMQIGHANVLATEARTAADAAALAGAEHLRGQLYNVDLGVRARDFDRSGPCDAAARYAERNGAELTACTVEIDVTDFEFAVSVTVRGQDGTIEGPSSTIPEMRPESRARAKVDLPRIRGPFGWAHGSGSLLNSMNERDARHDEFEDATADEMLEAMIEYADWVHDQQMPYVWGGGHQSSPAPRDGPFDCSGAVSALLQTVYDVPTMVSGDFTRMGRPGRSPSGRGLELIAYDGHVFATIGGRGWGTGENGWSTGAGWLPYNDPYHSQFQIRHIPELEPLDPAAIAALVGNIASGNDPGAQPGRRSLVGRVILTPVD